MLRTGYILLISLILVLASCSMEKGESTVTEQAQEKNTGQKQLRQDQQSKFKEKKKQTFQGEVKPDIAQQASYTAYQVEGVRDVATVVLDDDLSLAFDVKQLHRFQLEGMRKKVFHALRKEHPQMKIHVSTDRKILWELQKLEERMYDSKPDVKSIKKKLDKINEDMKG